ncbi:DUF292-domain-containing protein [Mycena sanguinolenta]|uniref:DUF292-domain-containing protein n=1 Tax=Mycena sanguinolenta TaxID=230812 RepID=A0A8H6YR51_9AGAR|nr:DUF292-domain-containing protein [Mycena sanguinolenta]
MAGPRWDPTSVKALFRLTSQRLGQLQEKKDSQASITRRDIATLLQQGNVPLARAKAQNLIQEDVAGDLLETLEMHIGILLEHFTEIDQQFVNSPVVLEAASSIIFAGASQTESRELEAVREILIQRLGEDFARSAVLNRDHHVASRVVHALSAPSPSAANLDMYLLNIAKQFGIQWVPEPRRQDILNILSEILDPEGAPAVDMPRLRQLFQAFLMNRRGSGLVFGGYSSAPSPCSRSHGRVKLGSNERDLVRRLLKPFSELPPPTTPLAQLDASLFNVSKQLSRIPISLLSGLQEESEHAGLCPLDENASAEIKIPYANILDVRLKAIQDRDSAGSTAIPEIRLDTPEISVSEPEPETLASRRQAVQPRTLVTSKPYPAQNTHPRHLTALFRILYLHSVINPGNHSPHIPALLVPLYSVLIQEVEPEDQSNAEADTFWLFEAMIGEFAELEDEEGGHLWMKKFGERLTWADRELAETLHAKGLDPALPHYSYRWLAPLLTQTLPLSSVLVVWDALFSCPGRERDRTPKLEYLLDICTAMLIRARAALFRHPGLWSEENMSMPPPSPLRAWEFGDAFVEGMSLLQLYPVEAAGGIDRLLQTASDLAVRRRDEAKAAKPASLTLGARLTTSMWKGFTNQMPSPEVSPPESEHEEEEPSEAESAQKGDEVLNGTSSNPLLLPFPPMMPPSPIRSPWPSSKEEPERDTDSDREGAPVTATIWNYAEKLKDSDAAAALSKVSSNWRARAILGSWGRGSSSNPPTAPPSPRMDLSPQDAYVRRDDGRHQSLPTMHQPQQMYSPPARPAFFRPVRDSIMGPPSPRPSSPPSSPPWSPQSEGGFLSRTRNLQDSFAALTGAARPAPPPTAPKSGPRPLLLGSTQITAPSHSRPGSVSEAGQWQHVPRGKGHSLRRESQSSASSLSPMDAVGARGVAATYCGTESGHHTQPKSRVKSQVRVSHGTDFTNTTNVRILDKYISRQRRRESLEAVRHTDSEVATSPKSPEAPPRSPRIRSKRYASRPANIRTNTNDLVVPDAAADQQQNPRSLSVDWPEQGQDAAAATPRATTFDDVSQPSGRLRKSSTEQARKMSGDNQESRARKISGGSRPRKTSTGTIRVAEKSERDSAAEEGDDEGGFEDLLSSYESEDSSMH